MKRLRGQFTESIDRVEKDNIVIGSTQRDEGDLVTCSWLDLTINSHFSS